MCRNSRAHLLYKKSLAPVACTYTRYQPQMLVEVIFCNRKLAAASPTHRKRTYTGITIAVTTSKFSPEVV